MQLTSKHLNYFKLLMLVVLLVGAIWAGFSIEWSGFYESPENLRNWVDGYGYWGPLATILLVLVTTVLFVPNAPFNVAAGVVFGFGMGLLYSAVGGIIGACIVFGIVKKLGEESIRTILGPKIAWINRYKNRMEAHGFVSVFILRLIPMPSSIVNFVFGLTRVSFKEYFFGTLLGGTPGMAFYVYIGISLVSFSASKIIIAFLLIVVVALLAVIFREHLKFISFNSSAV